MDNKTKLKISAVVLIGAAAIWMGVSMLGGDETQMADAKPQTRPNPDIPKPAPMLNAQAKPITAATPREQELMKMQQETENKYIAALEQLQLLLVEKDIANANKDIAAANKSFVISKKDTLMAQKMIVDTLTPPKPVFRPVVDSAPVRTNNAPPPKSPVANSAPDTYSVVSVSYTRGKWVAVLATTAGKLYSVSVGDMLLDDGSKVLSIGRSGVTLDNKGTERKLPMVSVI